VLRSVARLGIVVCLTLASGCGGNDDATSGPETVVISEREVYRVASASMEPTLHCAMPDAGCEATEADWIVTESVDAADIERGDIVVFLTPPQAVAKCGAGGTFAGGTFIQRVVGLPGETVEIRLDGGAAFVYVDGEKLDEPYIEADRRDVGPEETHDVPVNHYFVMGDDRSQSCDSRTWGTVPAETIASRVTRIVREE
jgi:signal peptidase I